MFIQQYDYEIVHRLGKRMAHVDALSTCNSVLVLEGSTFEPESMENNVIRFSHDDFGHVGVKKVISNITKVY